MKRKSPHKKGYTIIEVLISVAIFAIVAIPLSLMIINAVKINKKGEAKQQSMAIVQNTIENIKGIDSDALVNSLAININEGIKANRDSLNKEFKITGKYKGYTISGYAKPIEDYKYDVNTISVDRDVNIKVVEGNEDKLEVNDKTIPIYKNDSNTYAIEIIKKDDRTLLVNEISINNSEDINDISLLFNESCQNNYSIKVKNDSNKESSLYLFQKEESKSSYEVVNDGGVFKIYSNIVLPNKDYVDDHRAYEIYIKASKGDDTFEAHSYKTID